MSKHRVEIEFCTQCRWLMRAAWLAQELLTTFDGDLESLTLKPGTGGIFDISLDGVVVYSRKMQGRHADAAELKQLIRDAIDPERSLGHSDRKQI
ncbi:MAG TPA: SelT/SelW/SelH family protein [Methylophilus sp.]|nr:SelT/SelW/SelH family protein [Methylophilus sp.]HQQ32705.1 SelT/SelW/SelH family protein [Methylophilus sp.]